MAVYWVLQELLHQPFSWLMTRGAVRTRKGAISELIQLVGRDDKLQTESDGQAEHGEGADVALDVLPHTSFILGRRLHTFHSEHLWKSGIKIFTAKHASRVVVVVFTLAFRLPNVTYRQISGKSENKIASRRLHRNSPSPSRPSVLRLV